MNVTRPKRRDKREAGIALLIAIFILLLIGVVAISLIVSSGTESALAGNYRSSTSVYYAAAAGLEEVRARLRSNNPNSFNNTAPAFLPAVGLCSPGYVINPVGGEAITPWIPGSAYADNEFGQEFAGICGAIPSPSPTTQSIWNRNPLSGLPFSGPLYKWVRINGVSERSLNLDAFPYDTSVDPTLVYYDGINSRFNDTATGSQVFEVTALAVLPNGSQKLLQYLVAPSPIVLPPFLAALTLSGSNGGGGTPAFHAPANNTQYQVVGNDACGGAPVYAIGLFGDYTGGSYATDVNNLVNGIPAAPASIRTNNYPGYGNPSPDVTYLVGFPATFQSPAQLEAVVQMISQNADAVLPSGPVNYPLPNVSGPALNSLGMSATNPMTVVVNGNLDVSNWGGTGYGTLVVIGEFTYDPSATWNGIVLVIGQGKINNIDNGLFNQLNGAVFVAKTRDAAGNLLGAKIGGGSVQFQDIMQGNGIRYDSCWIQKAQPTSGYKVLSFHEISQ